MSTETGKTVDSEERCNFEATHLECGTIGIIPKLLLF